METIRTAFKRFHFRFEADPARDWLALLSVAGIVLAAILVWNIWMFDTVANGGTIGGASSAPQPAFSRSSLDAIRAVFTTRAAEEAKYVDGSYRYADPSQ